MKKLTAFLLSILLLLSLTACGGTQNTQTSSESGGKVFVVYFSASANTERVAREIAAVTDGTLFALTPTEPYTTEDLNWSDADSRVSREHSDENLRDIPLLECTPADWDSYGTVFIGYPIWWGGAAWPVNGFVTANDFTGKTVIPFATSASSGLGESAAQLAKLTTTGDWQPGQRFPYGADAQESRTWVASLGL